VWRGMIVTTSSNSRLLPETDGLLELRTGQLDDEFCGIMSGDV
jgi:hypothetical protein